MHPDPEIQRLGWQHELWGLVRLYRSLRVRDVSSWIRSVQRVGAIAIKEAEVVPIARGMSNQLAHYLAFAERQLAVAEKALRSETEALDECRRLGVEVTRTRTRNVEHHQSSKALVAEVSHLANLHCRRAGIGCDLSPQRRTVWLKNGVTHVSARNLDGVVPGLMNPCLVWEIKEYWGVTAGGSKMSDAVYECQLVGLELRNFELLSKEHVTHVVFLDGREQWGRRRSDLVRFIDLASQGLIDRLILGRQVAAEWAEVLKEAVPVRAAR